MYESAKNYLGFWLCEDRHHCKIFNSHKNREDEDRLDQLHNAMNFYRIARNFPAACEEDHEERYAPVLRIVDAIDNGRKQPVAAVEECAAKLWNEYGKYVLSAASKLLWIKFRSPIVIYDGNARKSLKAPEGDYAAYYELWRKEYAKNKSAVADACARLAEEHPGEQKNISQEWFRHRVLDSYLWGGGD